MGEKIIVYTMRPQHSAFCYDCNWELNKQRSPGSAARRHAKTHNHRVEINVVTGKQYVPQEQDTPDGPRRLTLEQAERMYGP